MSTLRIAIAASVVSIGAFTAPPAGASPREVPLPPRTEPIEGVPVTFTGKLFLEPEACERIKATARVSLADLNAKLTTIIKTAGVEKNQSCGDMVAINSAALAREGANLHIKVTGNVGRQECVKTKVPEFRGLKVTMKDRIVASKTVDTNASITATFDPSVADNGNTLHMRLVSGPHARVSNDIAKFLLNVFNLNGRIEHKMRKAVEGALARPDAMFTLPPELARHGINFSDARIVDAGGLALEVDGRIPLPDGFAPTTLALMGFDTGTCR